MIRQSIENMFGRKAAAYGMSALSLFPNLYPQRLQSYVAPRHKVAQETWAFCGVHPDDPLARRAARSLGQIGIDATMGPCILPDATYSPAEPGRRYVDPETYLRLTVINAQEGGMKTVVYDKRLWSDDATVRQAAIDFWAPHVAWVRAFDMGDEFDPSGPDWQILVKRWQIMKEYIVPKLGVEPYTNNLGSLAILRQSIQDLPGQAIVSFDAYGENDRHELADSVYISSELADETRTVMCATNTTPHSGYTPKPWTVSRQMHQHAMYGECDMQLLFGGVQPYGRDSTTHDDRFGISLIGPTGYPTSIGRAVLYGAVNFPPAS